MHQICLKWTPLEELTALHQIPQLDFRGPTSKGKEEKREKR